MNQDFVKGSYRALALRSHPPNAPPLSYGKYTLIITA